MGCAKSPVYLSAMRRIGKLEGRLRRIFLGGLRRLSRKGGALVRTGVALVLFSVAGAMPCAAEDRSCAQWMLEARVEDGKRVGPDACFVHERTAELDGKRFTRLDLGVSGTARGYIVAEGVRSAYFTTAPEFVFVQTGSDAAWSKATVRYEAEKGAGIALLLPDNRADWNGKLWLSVHGAGRSFEKGSLRPWDDRVTEDEPLKDVSLYERSMLARGFAVAKTFRSSDKQKGDCVVTLDGGDSREGFNITETPHIQLDWLALASRAVADRLGSAPRKIYFYGHSAGGRNGRLMNYLPGLNTGRNGWPKVDGFLIDDAGTGLWLPVLLRDGKDILFSDAASREEFAPQIDVTHQQYLAFKDEPAPEWVSGSYLLNKWENARLLKEKGLGDKHRMYEVKGVSHSGGEYVGGTPREGVEVIPLWRLMESVMVRLDAWVDGGQIAPATRSDFADLAGRSAAGIAKNSAIAMPEVACPLGVYHPYPAVLGDRGVGTTGFAAFDGKSEEPLDGRGVFVDMNRNGYHDYRETLSQAWARLGLVKEGERVTRERYVSCVSDAAKQLEQDGFLTSAVRRMYEEEARERPLPVE